MIHVRGVGQIIANLKKVEAQSHSRIREAMDFTITRAEGEAKNNAPWTDRTGNARNSITGVMLPDTKDKISAALFIGMEYGVYLELSNEGKYRIVWPTVLQSRMEFLSVIKALAKL